MKFGKRTEEDYKKIEEAKIEHFIQGHTGMWSTFSYDIQLNKRLKILELSHSYSDSQLQLCKSAITLQTNGSG
jgi:hypothetical protein